MSLFTNLVFSLVTANAGRSLFEVAAAITAHPVVAKKIRKIKRNPHVSVVTRFVATASDFVKAHVPAIVASAASVRYVLAPQLNFADAERSFVEIWRCG